MDADFSVELGAGDDVLEFPWESVETGLRYYDLKRQPEMLLYVEEAREYRELGEFLAAVSERSAFVTAKCDVWSERELSEAEEIYGAAMKLASYVDVLFEAEEQRFSFSAHERLAKRLCALLGKTPEIAAAVELVVRRCYYRENADEARSGFYLTMYVSGYGDEAADARQRWAIGMTLLQNALLQVTAEIRGAEARK